MGGPSSKYDPGSHNNTKPNILNKASNIKTAPNPNYNYPTVAAVKQFVAESALSADAQLVIDGKENVSNKSTNVVTDAGSNEKYPTVKAIKQYVDETTLGKSLAADINGKEEKSNKTDEIKQNETNANLYYLIHFLLILHNSKNHLIYYNHLA